MEICHGKDSLKCFCERYNWSLKCWLELVSLYFAKYITIGISLSKGTIETFPKRISILRNADSAKCRSKFKMDLSKKYSIKIPREKKYSIDPILKSFQRGYRYCEMLTMLNVDPNLKRDLSKK